MNQLDKTIPANPEAEEAVLGSLLIDPDAVIKIASFLEVDDFYREKNGWIYQAILDLHERREPADFVTLVDELERRNILQEVGGAAYITALVNSVPSAVHVEHYAHIVERAAVLRRLIGAAGQIASLAYEEADDVDEVVDRAEQLIFNVSERRVRRDLIPVRQVMHSVVDRIDYLHRHQGDVMGVPTGFAKLDKLLGGFQKSDLVILAARPAVGKTSLALNFALNAARRYRKVVGFFSLEMSAEQIVQRLLSMETGIDQQRLRQGEIRDDEWDMLMRAAAELSETLLYIDDTPAMSAIELRTKARRLAGRARAGPDPGGLSPAHARGQSSQREPRPGDQLHLALAQEPGARARGAADRAVAALARGGAAHRSQAATVRPARIVARSNRTPTSSCSSIART